MSGRFLVIGEGGTDVYTVGEVNRLAPDAPIPVINPTSTTYNAGMAGNVAANLLSLGADHVDTILSNPPITKTRYVDKMSGYILLRVDENDRVKNPFRIEQLMEKRGTTYDAILVSSYNKGFLTERDIAEIALEANRRNIPVFVDHKFIHGPWCQNVDFIKINRREYEAQLAAGVDPEKCCRNLIVSLGAEGSWWVNRNIRVPVEHIPMRDLSGAGDTTLSAFALDYCRNGGNVVEAMVFANKAARVAVSKHGVVAVKAEEII